jgi:transcriptional pleiotropic regulator of transition state genes
VRDTGIIRRVDELGRIVLPMELRRTMFIKEKDSLEIFLEEDRIILKKCEEGDVFTGDTEDLIEYCGRKVSKNSIVEMARLAGLRVES